MIILFLEIVNNYIITRPNPKIHNIAHTICLRNQYLISTTRYVNNLINYHRQSTINHICSCLMIKIYQQFIILPKIHTIFFEFCKPVK
jgi:hypothetical protein